MKNKILFLISLLFSGLLTFGIVWAQEKIEELCIDGVVVLSGSNPNCGYNIWASNILKGDAIDKSIVGFSSQEDAASWIANLRSSDLLYNPNPCTQEKLPDTCYKGVCRMLDILDSCTQAKYWLKNIPIDGAKVSFDSPAKMNSYIDETIAKISQNKQAYEGLNFDFVNKKFTQCNTGNDCIGQPEASDLNFYSAKNLGAISLNSNNSTLPSAPLVESAAKSVTDAWVRYVSENGHLGGSLLYARWGSSGLSASEKMNIWLYNANTNKQVKLIGNFIPNSQQNYGYAYDMSAQPAGYYYVAVEVASNAKLRAQSERFYFEGDKSAKKITSFIVSGYDSARVIDLRKKSNLIVKWSGTGFRPEDIIILEAMPMGLMNVGGVLNDFAGRRVEYKFNAGLNGVSFDLKNFPTNNWVLIIKAKSGSESSKISNDFSVKSGPKIYGASVYNATQDKLIEKPLEVYPVYKGNKLSIKAFATELDPNGSISIQIVRTTSIRGIDIIDTEPMVYSKTFKAANEISTGYIEVGNGTHWQLNKFYLVNIVYKNSKGAQGSVFKSVPFWYVQK